jgi:hypothetical protein
VPLGVLDPMKSFPSVPLDYDQDGRLDLFVGGVHQQLRRRRPARPESTSSPPRASSTTCSASRSDPAFSETAPLYHNTPDGFVDVTEELGLDDVHATMGLNVGDMNGDGWPDLYLATGAPEFDALEPNVAYLQRRRRPLPGRHHRHPAPGTSRRGTASRSATSTRTATRTCRVSMGGAFIGDVALSSLYINPLNAGETVTRHAVTLRLQGRPQQPQRDRRAGDRGHAGSHLPPPGGPDRLVRRQQPPGRGRARRDRPRR